MIQGLVSDSHLGHMPAMSRIILLAIIALLLPQPGRAEAPVEGYWLTENRQAIVKTRVCGAKICGDMVWVAKPVDEHGQTRVGADGKPLCGRQLIGDLKSNGNGEWDDGWVIDPRSGDRYSASLALVSPGKIELRGYLWLQALGASQVWTRVSDDRGGC